MRNTLLDPITAVETTELGGSDAAAATAARLELIALLAEAAAPKGYVTPCTILYRVPGMEFEQEITRQLDYAGIKALLLEELGADMAEYGMTSVSELLEPGSPIKVAFGRLMPGESPEMPDRIIVDGNDPSLMHAVSFIFNVNAAAQRTDVEGQDNTSDPNDLTDVEMFRTEGPTFVVNPRRRRRGGKRRNRFRH